MVECSESEIVTSPLKESVFKNLNITDVEVFKIITCPFSNVTLEKMLDGMKVKWLKIEARPFANFSSDFFTGLEDLTQLSLSNSNIETLPMDIFQNLTKLKRLDLNQNMFETLPDGLLDYQTELVQLQLSSNNIATLPANIFSNLTKLELLYLYKNKFIEIPLGLFNNLTSLTAIDVANNLIEVLQPELFEYVPALNHLNLKGNNLEALPGDLFQKTPKLAELDLSGNLKLKYIAEDVFYNLTNLTSVNMQNCNFTSIPDKLFAQSNKLKKLTLFNNQLSTLDENIFFNNSLLEEINLNYNNLSEIPINLFRNKFNLKKLMISYNNVQTLRVGVFEHLTSLKILHLTSNQLGNLNSQVMQPLQALEELKVSKNNISTLIGLQPFGRDKIKMVDLSFNNLTKLGNINWELYLQIERVDLRNNSLKFFSFPMILAKKLELDLTNNNIMALDLTDIEFSEFLQQNDSKSKKREVEMLVYLKGNDLECDCMLYDFVRYAKDYNSKRIVMFEDFDTLNCKGDKTKISLRGENLKSFTCPIVSNCSSSCSCDFRAVDRATVIKCFDLTELPTELPNNATEVYLQNNQISDLSSFDDEMWENVTVLRLDNNNITNTQCNWPPNLQILSLRANQIELLSDSTYEYIQNKNNTFEVYLSENPWYCDCATIQYKDFLQENAKKVRDLETIYCNNEVYINGSNVAPQIIKLPDDLCPQDNEVNNAYLITVSVVCVVLAILLFLVSVLYYRNKQMLTAYVYIHFYNIFVCFFNEEELDEDKSFDAFVSYSSADRDVALALIKELEEADPKFKLCIHERDWLPGNLITWNIANSVQNSRKTILVLSKNFLESLWFQIEFHTAYYQMLEDRIDRLIVIVKGDLPKKETLDKDLQFLLSTKTYLTWGERWFWEKLRFALPHHRALVGSEKKALSQRPNSNLLKTVEDKIASLTMNGDSNNKITNGGHKNGNAAYINNSLTIDDENKPKSVRGKAVMSREDHENSLNMQELTEVPKPPARPKRTPVEV